jgi:hypothetical protein
MPSFTSSLLTSDTTAYTHATTSPFLTSAARGTTSKALLGRWLANDRLYIHAYIAGTGRLLPLLTLPPAAPSDGSAPRDTSTRLLDWIVAALVNVRREEGFFLETAHRYGLDVNLPGAAALHSSSTAAEFAAAKLEGLRRWEALFGSIAAGPEGQPLPWLEGAVIFWGTEVCYLDAWTGVKNALDPAGDAAKDADGGALRADFINNWTTDEFRRFVDDLRDIIDDAVEEEVRLHGEDIRAVFYERALEQWKKVLAAEETFWPAE